MNTAKPRRPVSPRYASLPLIALILKLISHLALGFSAALLLVAIYMGITRHSLALFMSLGWTAIGGAISALVLLAFSELIHVLLDIEQNTRRLVDSSSDTPTGTTPRAETHPLL